MSGNESRRRPPPFPEQLVRKQRPRAVVEAERHLNRTVDRAVDAAVVEVLGVVQQKICEAVGLLDIGRTKDARVLLNRQVTIIDWFLAK